MSFVDVEAKVHLEDGSYWAEVASMPGVFASGETLEELAEALREAVGMYISDDGSVVQAGALAVSGLRLGSTV